MKRNYLFLLAGVFISTCLLAQDAITPANAAIKMERAGDAYCSPVMYVPLTAVVKTPSADLKWRPTVSPKMMESEPLEPNHEELEKRREEILDMKIARSKERFDIGNSNPSTLAVTPVVGVNYAANRNDGWSPLDNNVAISNHGIIITVSNDVMEIDDSTGHNLYYQTLNTLINDAAIPNACDPVVVYDKGADRFIFYCQEVTSTANAPNHMLFFFSKTNNPATGGWNYFKLSGDPLGLGSMADYPKMGITDNDVFLSSNLFVGGSYSQSIVWQIGKSQGYAGGTLVTKLWSGLTGSPFTILPVSEGQGNTYGPGIWMVASSSGTSTTINLYQVTNSVSASPTMNHYSVTTTSYSAAGPSQQLGTSATLDITDCRMLSGFYLNGIVHFVHSTADAQGNTAINYNRLDVNAKTNTSKLLSVNGTDYGYPAVASYTALGVTGDNSVMIGFAQANSTIYPEICVVSCDNTMNFGTVTVVKTSTSAVGSSGANRWGDYSGMCRRHNSPQACCWMSGSFGSSGSWDAYVAQIYDAGFATNVAEVQAPPSDLKTFPNPVMDMFSVDFTLETNSEKTDIAVYDMQGRMVKDLFCGFCHEGGNTFSFNKANLTSGTYFLIIRAGAEKVMHQKIIVAD
jgi:hypothetical protein